MSNKKVSNVEVAMTLLSLFSIFAGLTIVAFYSSCQAAIGLLLVVFGSNLTEVFRVRKMEEIFVRMLKEEKK